MTHRPRTVAEHQEAHTARLDTPSGSGRLMRMPFLDWTRGAAATVMLQGHVFHSFIRPELRDQGPYVISQFIGGLAPAVFLFLTGVTLAFMLHGMEKRHATTKAKIMRAVRRAGYLFMLAYLFRLQLWAFGLPWSQWTDLLKVDILNCMGMAILTMSVLGAVHTEQRAHAGVVVALLITVLSPLIPMNDQTTLPNLVGMYFAPDYRFFSYFPWAAFIAYGISFGSILRLTPEDQMHRFMQWSAILGFGIIMSAQYFSNVPYSLYPKTEYWLNSPGLIFIKLGATLVIIPLTFLWTHHGAGQGWSWVRQLGTTSLLIYWVHIELVYGRWFGSWKEKLDVQQCALAAAVLIVLMIALSWARTHVDWGAKWRRLRGVEPAPA